MGKDLKYTFRTWGTALGALALIALGGCSDAGIDAEADAELAGPEGMSAGPAPVEDVGPSGVSPGANHEVIAEVDVGYGKVQFHRLDTAEGFTHVLVSEMAPNNVGETPFSKLSLEKATHLELFRALQPEGEVPELLAALHSIEAEELGRETDEVRALSFDKDAPIEKSVATCEAFVVADPPDNCGVRTWGNGRIATNVSGSVGLHVGQYWAYSTTLPVTLGICNESNVTINGRIGIDYGGDSSSAYTYWGWATLPVGWKWRWYDFREVTTCRSCSGNICTIIHGCYNPSRYRVDGSSPSGKKYILRTDEVYQPNCFDF